MAYLDYVYGITSNTEFLKKIRRRHGLIAVAMAMLMTADDMHVAVRAAIKKQIRNDQQRTAHDVPTMVNYIHNEYCPLENV